MHFSCLLAMWCVTLVGLVVAGPLRHHPQGVSDRPLTHHSDSDVQSADETLRKVRNLSRHARSAVPGGRTSSKSRVSGGQRRKPHDRPELSGDVVFSVRRVLRLYFDFDFAALSDSVITEAHVLVYHPRASRRNVARTSSRRRHNNGTKTRKPQRLNYANVVMQQTIVYGENFGTGRTLDIKRVDADRRVWVSFDITAAVRDWTADPTSNHGLELWVASARRGRRPARIARRMRFVKPTSARLAFRPQLVVKMKPVTNNGPNLNTLDQ